MENISFLTAFLAGLISFFTPCVLPLVPGYLSLFSGVALDDIKNKASGAFGKVIWASLAFILGFSLVFILMGATATFIGSFLENHMDIIQKIAGVVVVIFGLHMTGIFQLKFLLYEKKFHSQSGKVGLVKGFLMGMAFAFGWTPCIGPILAPIIFMASQQEHLAQGVLLLSAYSLGLAIPFFLTALSLRLFFSLFKKIQKHFKVIEIIAGIFLIIVGVMIFFGVLQSISNNFM